MTDEQKREYAEAIKASLGFTPAPVVMGPPMEGEEGWVPPRRCQCIHCAGAPVEAGRVAAPKVAAGITR